jgi:hypothetical protein
MNEIVAKAVDEIRSIFPDANVRAEEDGDGGAWVTVEPVPIGALYVQESTWIGFRITFQYPAADVYPHFVQADLRRKDGRPLGEATSPGHNFRGRPAIQLSRRSNRLNPATDTAALKLQKVLKWLETHP